MGVGLVGGQLLVGKDGSGVSTPHNNNKKKKINKKMEEEEGK